MQNASTKKQGLFFSQLHCLFPFSSSVSLLEGDLVEVEALRDVKLELIAKKEVLYSVHCLLETASSNRKKHTFISVVECAVPH